LDASGSFNRSRTRGGPVQLSFFLLALIAGPAAGALPLHLRLWHAHDLVGDAIGLDLILIARLVDGELGLEAGDGSVAGELLKAQHGMYLISWPSRGSRQPAGPGGSDSVACPVHRAHHLLRGH